jgi:hypothetical protein
MVTSFSFKLKRGLKKDPPMKPMPPLVESGHQIHFHAHNLTSFLMKIITKF